MKIEKLTQAQIDKFPEYVENWLNVGLSTGDCNFEAAKEACIKVYESAGLPAPKHFYVFDSPVSAAVGTLYLKAIYGNVHASDFDKIGDQVRAQVGDQVGDQVWAQVWAQVRAQVRAQVGDQVWDQVRAQVGDQVRAQVGDQVWAQVGDQVWDQVWAQVGAQVWAQVWAQVRAQVRAQVWAQVGAQVGDQVYGSQDAPWLAFYDFFRIECGIEECEKLAPLMELARHVGWWAPYENVAIFQHKPTHIKFDDANRLHCEDGPAVAYRDGFGVYSWHGVRVPADWIENRETLDPSAVVRCENVEQRAAGAQIVGWPKMLNVLDAKVINDSGSPDIGQLIELTLPGLPKPGRFLKAECPRNGTIVEGVPYTSDIDGLPIETAIAAQAWRIGDPQSEYQHPEKRT